MSGTKYWVWLNERKGIPLRLKHALLGHFGEPESIFYAQKEAYLRVEGMTPELAGPLEDKDTAEADRILGECRRLGIRIVTMQDADYPGRLRNIFEPPCLLFVRGRLPEIDDEVAVAMVGTRGATPYGIASAQDLSFSLAKRGVLIVSGAALGIDTAAHNGALLAGARTVAVLGCGVDVVYPPENEQLLADIAATGALVSEYPPGTSVQRRYFPERNRIISGLCLAAVVVEAPARSGALITAHTALEQGRDVFAVPGPISAPESRGSNGLIARGEAALLPDADTLIREYEGRFPHKLHHASEEPPPVLGYRARREAKDAEKRKKTARSKKTGRAADDEDGEANQLRVLDIRPGHTALTDDQILILRELKGGEKDLDQLIELTELSTRRVLSALTALEIDSTVELNDRSYSLNVELTEE